jgi:DNA ligase-associated metallophosphoesterase
VEVVIAGERLMLMPERAVFWPRRQMLFVADLHLGKAAAYRARGIPVPEGVMSDDLGRLSRAIVRTDATHLIVLGDVLHARESVSAHVHALMMQWRHQHPHVRWMMVRGNHDLRSGDPPAEWQIELVEAGTVHAPFVLAHEPRESGEGYVLCGHVHPAAKLNGRGGLRAKLPCFVVGQRRMILPAFSAFTGGTVAQPEDGDGIICIADDQLIAVSL